MSDQLLTSLSSAVRAFGTSLMKEVVGTGIRVTEVAPGFVETNFSVTRFRGDEEAAKAVYKGMTPRRYRWGSGYTNARSDTVSLRTSAYGTDARLQRRHCRRSRLVRSSTSTRADCRAL